jgi:Zn-dependent protease
MEGTFTLGPFLLMMGIVTVAVLTEFLLHELAHKFTAQKFGCWSEYRYTEFGLILTLVTGFFGYVFAAPGVVWHSGRITREQEGKISAAGPATNLALAALFFAIWFTLPVTGILKILLWFVAWINVWVGAFNLIPISPLDGSKIWKWNIPLYIGMWMAFILVGIGLHFPAFMTLLGR